MQSMYSRFRVLSRPSLVVKLRFLRTFVTEDSSLSTLSPAGLPLHRYYKKARSLSPRYYKLLRNRVRFRCSRDPGFAHGKNRLVGQNKQRRLFSSHTLIIYALSLHKLYHSTIFIIYTLHLNWNYILSRIGFEIILSDQETNHLLLFCRFGDRKAWINLL